jgi:hypothetical protein
LRARRALGVGERARVARAMRSYRLMNAAPFKSSGT